MTESGETLYCPVRIGIFCPKEAPLNQRPKFKLAHTYN